MYVDMRYDKFKEVYGLQIVYIIVVFVSILLYVPWIDNAVMYQDLKEMDTFAGEAILCKKILAFFVNVIIS